MKKNKIQEIILKLNYFNCLTVTHFLIPCRVSGFSNIFFSLDSGPSASTARHFENISQYPWVPAHAEPGLRMNLKRAEIEFIQVLLKKRFTNPLEFRIGLYKVSIVKESTQMLLVSTRNWIED